MKLTPIISFMERDFEGSVWVVITQMVVVLVVVAGCQRDGSSVGPVRPAVVVPGLTAEKSANDPDRPRILFVDRARESKLQFTYRNDEEHSGYSILESLGGGVAIFDYDGDSRLDILLPGGGRFGDRQNFGLDSALFRNSGTWSFDDVTKAANVGSSNHYSHGASVADFNEDGFDDVLITGYGGLMLYENSGDGTFQEVIGTGLDDSLWSSSAAWGDFTGDGVLDLLVAHYVDWSFDNNPECEGSVGHPREVCPPRRYQGLPQAIFYGNGDGTFRNASEEAGLHAAGKGLGVAAADIDIDGDLDLYIANDTIPNLLYLNNGHGKFEDVSLTSGTAFSEQGTPDGSMGVDVGDYNGDGLPDIWVTNYERENNALYRNLGGGTFRHISQAVGIASIGAMFVGWGTRFIDADLDGDEDLIVANGHVIRFPTNTPRRQRPLVLENSGGKRFVNVSREAGDYTTSPHCGRGLATGDLDGDGDEDVVISNLNEPVAVLSNESTPKRHWLGIRIIGRRSSRSAIGAVTVVRIGQRSMMRLIRGGTSFGSTSDPKLRFGCDTSERVDEVTITWLSGAKIVLKDVECDRTITVLEPNEPTL